MPAVSTLSAPNVFHIGVFIIIYIKANLMLTFDLNTCYIVDPFVLDVLYINLNGTEADSTGWQFLKAFWAKVNLC
jgi:Uma2 family endonuclease